MLFRSGGLGLPDKAYYIDPSPKMAELRSKYVAHIEAMLKLAGVTEPAQRAAHVFELETKMAKVHASRVESEDVTKAVVWKRAELATKAPGLDWPALLEAAQLNGEEAFFIWHPQAIPGLSALTASEPLANWKDWLTYRTIASSATYLSKAFVDEQFNFFGKALTGTLQLRERWQRGVDLTSNALGGLVGKAYVDKYFPPESKTRIQAMVGDLSKAFEKRIDALTWMSPDTKLKAKQKLKTLIVGVGYPDKWADYSSLEVSKSDPLGNARNASLFAYRQQLAKLHQPIDKAEWWIDRKSTRLNSSH